MKNTTIDFRKAIGGATTLFIILFFSHSAVAQCPSTIPPTSVAWTMGTGVNYTIPGTTCEITVFECWRSFPDPSNPSQWDFQTYIDEVLPQYGSTGCETLSPEQLISYAVNLVMNDPSTPGLQSVPCGGGNSQFVSTVATDQCYYVPSETTTLQGYEYGEGILSCNSGVYCIKTCQACWDVVNQQVVLTNCTETSSGTPDCSTSPPVQTLPWSPGICYLVGCNY